MEINSLQMLPPAQRLNGVVIATCVHVFTCTKQMRR